MGTASSTRALGGWGAGLNRRRLSPRTCLHALSARPPTMRPGPAPCRLPGGHVRPLHRPSRCQRLRRLSGWHRDHRAGRRIDQRLPVQPRHHRQYHVRDQHLQRYVLPDPGLARCVPSHASTRTNPKDSCTDPDISGVIAVSMRPHYHARTLVAACPGTACDIHALCSGGTTCGGCDVGFVGDGTTCLRTCRAGVSLPRP